MMKLEINSAQEMQKLGASLGKVAKPGSLLLLNGDLGAGKTTMTQ
ncbi:tRNA (adenosine(37)-N6)-threonylcarbamoyltransferase complex ATPase subunit type 1 TsaE, partial [Enterococcus faecalis]